MNETRERLLEAAIRTFARRGYAGTSIREITREAGANLGAVTYHYGGKPALYEAALKRCIGPLSKRVAVAALGSGSPVDRLDGVVAVFFEYLRERPELPQLMLQETVAGRVPPPGALALLRSVLGTVGGLIRDGQAAGLIREGDADLMAVSVVSQPLHLTAAARVVAGLDTESAAVRSRLLGHASGFIRHGLSVEGS